MIITVKTELTGCLGGVSVTWKMPRISNIADDKWSEVWSAFITDRNEAK